VSRNGQHSGGGDGVIAGIKAVGMARHNNTPKERNYKTKSRLLLGPAIRPGGARRGYPCLADILYNTIIILFNIICQVKNNII
jgi:hypothetical protein